MQNWYFGKIQESGKGDNYVIMPVVDGEMRPPLYLNLGQLTYFIAGLVAHNHADERTFNNGLEDLFLPLDASEIRSIISETHIGHRILDEFRNNGLL